MNQSKEASTENIKVFLRMRPPSRKEIDLDETEIWSLGKNYVKLSPDAYNTLARKHQIHSAPYTKTCFFNGCFDKAYTNISIYAETLKNLVEGSLSGINGTLFLYGQTGAGKTYTMMGDYSEEIIKSSPLPNARANSRTPVKNSARSNNTSRIMAERSHTPLAFHKESARNSIVSEKMKLTPTKETPRKNRSSSNEGVLILWLKDLFARISKVILYNIFGS